MKLRLCVDLDNVLGFTDEVMRQVISDYTHGRVNLDYEDIIFFDYQRCKDRNGEFISAAEWHDIHKLFCSPKYLWQVRPFPDVQDHLRNLMSFFDIHIATSRLSAARRVTVEWLEAYNFPPHDLHFLSQGKKHLSLGTFAALVEDNYEQAANFANRGTESYLVQHPWNVGKPHLGHLCWVKDWAQLSERLVDLGRQ